jgi:hypothetical protein
MEAAPPSAIDLDDLPDDAGIALAQEYAEAVAAGLFVFAEPAWEEPEPVVFQEAPQATVTPATPDRRKFYFAVPDAPPRAKMKVGGIELPDDATLESCQPGGWIRILTTAGTGPCGMSHRCERWPAR